MRTDLNHRVLQELRQFECRNTTFIDPDGTWPIVWERARGCHVWDANGKRYLDLTSAFAVANSGHANPAVIRAGQKQMGTLLHAMGDVHPHPLKSQLARQLSKITFERWIGKSAKSLFATSGFEAVEVALKTARLATGRKNVLAFTGGYHGLGYGALNVTHRRDFSEPFRDQLGQFGEFAPYPTDLKILEKFVQHFSSKKYAAILVEPIQGRGGIHIPAPGFLHALREMADSTGSVLIFDEIMSGFGRTGKWFACEHENVVPDLVCVGKALTGGFPLSACVGKADLMDGAWPDSKGEALHTSTFLGHPVGCAMALAQIGEIKKLLSGVNSLGNRFGKQLSQIAGENPEIEARGQGLMWGVQVNRIQLPSGGPPKGSGACKPRLPSAIPDGPRSIRIVKNLLNKGFIVLPEGPLGEVIGFTPALNISAAQLKSAAQALAESLREVA